MTITTPLAEPIAALEAKREQAVADLAAAEQKRVTALQKKRERGSQLEDHQIEYHVYSAALHTLEQVDDRIERLTDYIADLDAAIEAKRHDEERVVPLHNRRTNVFNSLSHHRTQLVGKMTDLVDTFEDDRAANRQLAKIEEELETLGDPTAGDFLAQVEPPPTLPLDLSVALVHQAVCDAVAVERQRPLLRDRMNTIIQSADPRRYELAQELSNRLAESDRIVSAIVARATVVDTPAPQVRDAVMGESRQLTQPGGVAGAR